MGRESISGIGKTSCARPEEPSCIVADATPPSSGFDGKWLNSLGSVVTIDGTTMSNQAGSAINLTITGQSTCSFEALGNSFQGLCCGTMKLAWSDGDIWHRLLSSPDVQLPLAEMHQSTVVGVLHAQSFTKARAKEDATQYISIADSDSEEENATAEINKRLEAELEAKRQAEDERVEEERMALEKKRAEEEKRAKEVKLAEEEKRAQEETRIEEDRLEKEIDKCAREKEEQRLEEERHTKEVKEEEPGPMASFKSHQGCKREQEEAELEAKRKAKDERLEEERMAEEKELAEEEKELAEEETLAKQEEEKRAQEAKRIEEERLAKETEKLAREKEKQHLVEEMLVALAAENEKKVKEEEPSPVASFTSYQDYEQEEAKSKAKDERLVEERMAEEKELAEEETLAKQDEEKRAQEAKRIEEERLAKETEKLAREKEKQHLVEEMLVALAAENEKKVKEEEPSPVASFTSYQDYEQEEALAIQRAKAKQELRRKAQKCALARAASLRMVEAKRLELEQSVGNEKKNACKAEEATMESSLQHQSQPLQTSKAQHLPAAALSLGNVSFDGRWKDEDGSLVTIDGDMITGDDGNVLQIKLLGEDQCSVRTGESIVEGKLIDSGAVLLWMDGARWDRVPMKTEVVEDLGRTCDRGADLGAPSLLTTGIDAYVEAPTVVEGTDFLRGGLQPGMTVRIKNLQSRADLNGSHATLIVKDQTKDRWQVLVDGQTSKIMAKEINLEPIVQKKSISSLQKAATQQFDVRSNPDIEEDRTGDSLEAMYNFDKAILAKETIDPLTIAAEVTSVAVRTPSELNREEELKRKTKIFAI